jgi:membrane protein required for colicin V production
MIEAQVNYFDATVIVILLLSCLFAFFRGFVREVLSLGAWVGAAIVTAYCFPQVAELLEPHFKSPMVAAGIGTLGLYISALIGFSIINMVIMRFVKSGSDVGILDNLLGLLFGAARGMLIVSLGYFMLSMAVPEDNKPEWLDKALTRPIAERGALWLAEMAPSYLKDVARFQEETTEKLKEVKDDTGNKTDGETVQPEEGQKDGAFQQLLNDMGKKP